MTAKTKELTLQAPEKVEPKAPKPIAYEAQGEVKAVKAGTKLASLIDALSREGGATIEELAAELSRTGSPVDASGVRSWISYDLRRVGFGCRQEGDQLHLLGTPLPHKVAEPKKTPDATIKIVESEPKMKKAAMTAARSKKASRKVAAK